MLKLVWKRGVLPGRWQAWASANNEAEMARTFELRHGREPELLLCCEANLGTPYLVGPIDGVQARHVVEMAEVVE